MAWPKGKKRSVAERKRMSIAQRGRWAGKAVKGEARQERNGHDHAFSISYLKYRA